MGTLNLFPARIEIGQFKLKGADGRETDIKVYPSPELVRAFADLFARVGAANGADTASIELAAGFAPLVPPVAPALTFDSAPGPGSAGEVATLRAELQNALLALEGARVAAADAVARMEALELSLAPTAALPVDWENRLEALEMQLQPAPALSIDLGAPGPIGYRVPGTGKFTTIESTVAVGTAPLIVASTTQVANLNVSQLVGKTWAAPAAIGTTTPAAANFTTVGATGEIRVSQAVGGVVFGAWSANANASNRNWAWYHNNTAYGNLQLRVSNASGGDPDAAGAVCVEFKPAGMAVTVGFGCNGKAAQTSLALGAAAVDLPTVIVLANNLRTMSINNGMGS